MNELQVKTIELVPAQVDFNFDELSQVLDEQLAKYEGLEFFDEDAAACKKTITELNKGKKALNDYRLKTKKELSKEITDFEAKCKNLSNKFDDVIKPLKEQHDQFEEDRKEEKREKIVPIVEKLIEAEGLNEKFSAQLSDIPNEYLNKSKTIKSITTELTEKAKHLGISQDKEEADKEIVKGHVELINAKNDTDLLDITYMALLDHDISVGEIKNQIEKDAAIKIKNATQVPLSSAPGHVEDDDIYTETYQVEGTEYDLEMLEEYMSSNSLTWKVVEG
ncbi:DUF1351 domain-containing protein [Gracilibacillus alcaliphilus]|uniref:DUF1351 domain-containing protein n=1 Tax=Gracilibacillus alcaliphilus TaxID=1401441 RepID=UPI00195ADF76|nr:DUF1351 domain-containing protein [Gracilibacillus alcaliphilus]MBM7679551.1 hypothetical protein [Gracilibacillus alcaliphilus]